MMEERERKIKEVVKTATDIFFWNFLGRIYVRMKFDHPDELTRIISESMEYAFNEAWRRGDLDSEALSEALEGFRQEVVRILP